MRQFQSSAGRLCKLLQQSEVAVGDLALCRRIAHSHAGVEAQRPNEFPYRCIDSTSPLLYKLGHAPNLPSTDTSLSQLQLQPVPGTVVGPSSSSSTIGVLVQDANQELADIFGSQFATQHADVTSSESGEQVDRTTGTSYCLVSDDAASPSVEAMYQEDGLRVERNAGKTSLTHVDSEGRACMVGVGDKPITKRTSSASGRVLLGRETFQLVAANKLKKGDVLPVAQLAGIMAAKQTSHLVPLCHNIPLSKVDVRMSLDAQTHAVVIVAEAECHGQTGVEMEALTAVTVAALTVFDMCKAASHAITIADVQLEDKTGGQTGKYTRANIPTTNIRRRVGGTPTMQ